ncbi:MAG: hypothetical protein Tsb0020_39160 [Haliangiales bacterium]
MSDQPDNETIERLLSVCRVGNSREQCAALVELSEMGASATAVAIPTLIALLASPEEVVRANAAHTLGRLGGAQPDVAGAALLALVQDSDAIVRSDVIEALGALKYQPSVDAIAARLQSDTDATVRAEAAETLAELNDDRGLPTILRALADDPDDAVRGYCASAVARLGTAAMLPTLRQHTTEEPSVRVKAELLGARYQLGDQAALPAFLALMSAADEDLAINLLNVLDDLIARNPPATLSDDSALIAAALTQLAERFEQLGPHATALRISLPAPTA